MPNYDQTGPEGKGPRTGQQRGKCGQNSSQTSISGNGPRTGTGMGRNQGRGRNGRKN